MVWGDVEIGNSYLEQKNKLEEYRNKTKQELCLKKQRLYSTNIEKLQKNERIYKAFNQQDFVKYWKKLGFKGNYNKFNTYWIFASEKYEFSKSKKTILVTWDMSHIKDFSQFSPFKTRIYINTVLSYSRSEAENLALLRQVNAFNSIKFGERKWRQIVNDTRLKENHLRNVRHRVLNQELKFIGIEECM